VSGPSDIEATREKNRRKAEKAIPGLLGRMHHLCQIAREAEAAREEIARLRKAVWNTDGLSVDVRHEVDEILHGIGKLLDGKEDGP
jgi:hypothetical protein